MNEFEKNAVETEVDNEPEGKAGETKAEKFIRLGEYRVNKAISAINRLENLANRSSYEYTQAQVDVMFAILESRLADIKAKFQPAKPKEEKAFSFGAVNEE